MRSLKLRFCELSQTSPLPALSLASPAQYAGESVSLECRTRTAARRADFEARGLVDGEQAGRLERVDDRTRAGRDLATAIDARETLGETGLEHERAEDEVLEASRARADEDAVELG